MEQAESIINVKHLGQTNSLVVSNNLPVAKNDIARVVESEVAVNRHQSLLATAFKKICAGRKRSRQIRIAIKHKKLFPELGQRLPQGSAGAEQLRAVEGII